MHQSASEPGANVALHKTIKWWDGVAITLSIPAALIICLGYSVGAMGAWPAIILWVLIAFLALLHNWLYTELGAMFPDKSGGISLYANEAWSQRAPRLGPLASFAYWFVWATAPAIWGLTVAQILTEQFWPTTTFSLNIGVVDLNLAQATALVIALLSWALSLVKLRAAMLIMTLAALFLLVPLMLFSSWALFTPSWSTASFTWRLGADVQGVRTFFAWLFVMAWAAYSVEVVASFIPEFRDTVNDTRKSMRFSAILLLIVFTLISFGLVGLLGESVVTDHPMGFLQLASQVLSGGGAAAVTIVLIIGIVVLSIMGTADAARSLYQSSLDGLTIRQFGLLNARGIPARAVTVQLVINVLLVLFVGNPMAIIVASNIGYVLVHVLATSGFVLLRKDRPLASRPIRLSQKWVGIAVFLAIFDSLILVIGVASASITGYGGYREVLIAIGVLAISQLLYYLRSYQDKKQVAVTHHEPT